MIKETRLEQIVHIINTSQTPVSGGVLAHELNVSRQVIVQDIALLRARNIEIISTHKGYIIPKTSHKREIKVCHSSQEMELELNTIVDLGGKVENVFVNHDVYGKLEAKLNIASRRDVKMFMDKIQSKESKPLTDLTSGYHSHVITASSEEILNEIEQTLFQQGILCADNKTQS